jgi:uridine monophosphate synthetase
MLSYEQRLHAATNPTAKRLLQIMLTKRSNLVVSADLRHSSELLALAQQVAPFICVLKTHMDIVEDFTPALARQLADLAAREDFLLFEDRKFADIGHTVQAQYQAGVHKIVEWADIIDAHPLPGVGIVEGLQAVGLAKGRGLLLLAQMSSQGNLIDADYTQQALAIASAYPDFVIGVVAQQQLSDDPRLLHFTPGVSVDRTADSLGQHYVTPMQALTERGSDLIIVGRSIYAAADPAQQAQTYQAQGWQAYLAR